MDQLEKRQGLGWGPRLKRLALPPFFCLVGMMDCPLKAETQWGVSAAWGKGVCHSTLYRTGLLFQSDRILWRTPHAVSTWYGELAYGHLGKRRETTYPYAIDAQSLSAVWRWKTWPARNSDYFAQPRHWYVDLGIGASRLSRKNFGGRRLGSYLQFEDRLGFGLILGQKSNWDIGYRALHYSNAYLGSCNHGVNVHTVVLQYWS